MAEQNRAEQRKTKPPEPQYAKKGKRQRGNARNDIYRRRNKDKQKTKDREREREQEVTTDIIISSKGWAVGLWRGPESEIGNERREREAVARQTETEREMVARQTETGRERERGGGGGGRERGVGTD